MKQEDLSPSKYKHWFHTIRRQWITSKQTENTLRDNIYRDYIRYHNFTWREARRLTMINITFFKNRWYWRRNMGGRWNDI